MWLITFISLFTPVYFTSEDLNDGKGDKRAAAIRLQYATFRYLSFAALIVYGAALSAIGIIVNMPLGKFPLL